MFYLPLYMCIYLEIKWFAHIHYIALMFCQYADFQILTTKRWGKSPSVHETSISLSSIGITPQGCMSGFLLTQISPVLPHLHLPGNDSWGPPLSFSWVSHGSAVPVFMSLLLLQLFPSICLHTQLALQASAWEEMRIPALSPLLAPWLFCLCSFLIGQGVNFCSWFNFLVHRGYDFTVRMWQRQWQPWEGTASAIPPKPQTLSPTGRGSVHCS